VTAPVPAPAWLYRCGTCGRPISSPSQCRACGPHVGVSIVGCIECRRCRTFATEVADDVARKHERARGHRTWVVLDQSLLAPCPKVPAS
jgi:hypothetical protein